MTLMELQRGFRDRLLAAQAAEAPAGAKIYHNAYRVRLCDSLKETFERVFIRLGEKEFLAAAKAHIECRPPRDWTLGAYGGNFPETLAEIHPREPGIAELARLDWMLCRAFDGADALAIAQPPPGLDWDSARFRFVPTFRLAGARTNAGAIWSALAAGETPPPPALLPAQGGLLVWRQELVPCFRTIEADEHAALAMMRDGASFGAVCGFLTERRSEEDAVATAGAWLGQWLADGLILDIR